MSNQRESAEGPRRIFTAAAKGDGELNTQEMRALLISDMHFVEGSVELEELMTTMDADGDGRVDEFVRV